MSYWENPKFDLNQIIIIFVNRVILTVCLKAKANTGSFVIVSETLSLFVQVPQHLVLIISYVHLCNITFRIHLYSVLRDVYDGFFRRRQPS